MNFLLPSELCAWPSLRTFWSKRIVLIIIGAGPLRAHGAPAHRVLHLGYLHLGLLLRWLSSVICRVLYRSWSCSRGRSWNTGSGSSIVQPSPVDAVDHVSHSQSLLLRQSGLLCIRSLPPSLGRRPCACQGWNAGVPRLGCWCSCCWCRCCCPSGRL